MNKYIKKSLKLYFFVLDKFSKESYKKQYMKYLSWLGIKIDRSEPSRTWISPTVFLDSSSYERIKIGNHVTISFDVAILVHDYSIRHAAWSLGKDTTSMIYRDVTIGNNVLIGARSVILPGAVIGDNCIIGGGSVIRGVLESNSIYAGNPAIRVGDISKFADKYIDLIEVSKDLVK